MPAAFFMESGPNQPFTVKSTGRNDSQPAYFAARRGSRNRRLRQFLETNSAVLHLTAVALQANRSGRGDIEGGFEHFAIASAERLAAADGDDDLIPVLRLVMLQMVVRPRDEIVAALQLRPANEDAAVGVGRGAEFQFQDEILGEFARGGDLLNLPKFGRRGHNQPVMFGDVAAVRADGLAVELDGLGDDGP